VWLGELTLVDREIGGGTTVPDAAAVVSGGATAVEVKPGAEAVSAAETGQ
jgi:hypothetical protein